MHAIDDDNDDEWRWTGVRNHRKDVGEQERQPNKIRAMNHDSMNGARKRAFNPF